MEMGDGVANAPHRTASTDDDVDASAICWDISAQSKPKAGVVDVLRGGRGDGLAAQ
jgi:hypothetical protein